MGARQDFEIWQGKTFSQQLRWEAPPRIYKAISNIQNSAPVRLTVPGHGIPDGWRAAVQSVKGMIQINAAEDPPEESDFRQVTVIDANTIEFNEINALEFKNYSTGGVLIYNTPVSLVGYTARMTIRDRVGGTTILELTTENDRIVIDDAGMAIILQITAADTAALEPGVGTYDLEMVSGTGVVTGLLYGSISIKQEVTT